MSEEISAVVLAAGRGTRLNNALPKAYIALNGRALLAYSLEQFARCAQISEIVVVIRSEDKELLRRSVELPQKPKKFKIVYGGAERQDSALAGAQAATGEYLLIHDAARPLVSLELIERVIEATKAYGAAVPALRVADSLKLIQGDRIIENIDREELVRVQTPQGGQRDLLLRALKQACAEDRYFTDEAGALLAILGVRAKIVAGDERNIKITTQGDLEIASCWLCNGLDIYR